MTRASICWSRSLAATVSGHPIKAALLIAGSKAGGRKGEVVVVVVAPCLSLSPFSSASSASCLASKRPCFCFSSSSSAFKGASLVSKSFPVLFKSSWRKLAKSLFVTACSPCARKALSSAKTSAKPGLASAKPGFEPGFVCVVGRGNV